MFFRMKFDKEMSEVHQEMMEGKDFFLLDVREQDEYEEGHLPGAVCISLQKAKQQIDVIPQDKPVYVYCRSGQRSNAYVNFLKDQGRTNVYNIGGIIYWEYEVEK